MIVDMPMEVEAQWDSACSDLMEAALTVEMAADGWEKICEIHGIDGDERLSIMRELADDLRDATR